MRERRIINRKKTDIHRGGVGYRVTKLFADISTRMSYTRSEYTGLENIPEDGIVIFAPNHCNTLIDALHILRMRWNQTVFGARADLFNKPALAKLLTFLKILPMVRVRDGLSNVTKNYDTMGKIYTVLGDGVPFCMFAEGTHRPKHSLLPLKKGLFRIALEVNSLYDKPVYVVPVGLEYGDYFRYASSILVNVGEPINVTEYVRDHSESKEAEIYRGLLEMLHEKISGLITYIPDDDEYEKVWDYVKIATAGKRPFSLKKRLDNNRAVVESILADKEGKSELLSSAVEFDKKRKKAGISSLSLGFKYPAFRTSLKTLVTVLLLPVTALVMVMAIPSLAINTFLCKKVIKDRAFRNSVRAAVNMLVGLVLALAMLITSVCMGHSYWLVICGFIAPFMSLWTIEWYRVLFSDYMLMCRADIRKAFSALRK